MFRIMFLVTILLSLFVGISSCGEKLENNPLTVLSITGGNVLIQKTGSNNWNTGKEGMTLETGNKIKTDVGSKATITFLMAVLSN